MGETATLTSDRRSMGCMEIWGGNEAIDSAIAVAGIDAWVFSRPFQGDDRGGDIHYVSTCGHGHVARFAVADVSGHGAEAGQLSARLRTLMRRHINKLDQTRFVRALNKEFSALASAGTFATALLTSYYAPTDHLLVCNAGHPPPLWYRARTRQWQLLDHDVGDRVSRLHNLPLGVIEPTKYTQFAVQLDKDDLVVIYTDWLIETRQPTGEALGRDGLLELVRSMDGEQPERVYRALLGRTDQIRGAVPASDDMTLMVLHHNAADPPPRSAGDMLRMLTRALGLVKV